AGNSARVDGNGDPLPPGAVRRIGSNGFRHHGSVSRVAYTPDGKALISISSTGVNDGTLYSWDAATGKLRWQLPTAGVGHYASVPVISKDGKKIAAMGRSYPGGAILCVAIFVSHSGQVLKRHEWPIFRMDDYASCFAVAPDLSTLAQGCKDGT